MLEFTIASLPKTLQIFFGKHRAKHATTDEMGGLRRGKTLLGA